MAAVDRLSRDFKGDEVTRGQANFVGQQADRFGLLRKRLNASIGNAHDRGLQQLGAAASSAAAQQGGDHAAGAVTAGDTTEMALRRAKARAGIVARGEPAILNQQLRDRLSQVRSGVRGQDRALGAQIAGRGIEAGVQQSKADASGVTSAAQGAAFGSILGGLAGTMKNNKTNNGSIWDFGKYSGPTNQSSGNGLDFITTSPTLRSIS